jgi:hypothetical protein
MKTFRDWLVEKDRSNTCQLVFQESSEEEAWELIQKGNLVTVEPEAEPVKKFYQSLVKSLSKTPEEEQSFYYNNASIQWGSSTTIERDSPLNQLAIKITRYIDSLQIMPLSRVGVSILQLKDMGNKEEITALSPQNASPVGWEKFSNIVGSARSGEGRDTSYLNSLADYTDPSVLLRLGSAYYVIGGRTRLKASLATGRDAPVKVIDAGQLQQFLTRGS